MRDAFSDADQQEVLASRRAKHLVFSEGTKRTSASVQLPRLQKDLRAGSISRDIVTCPSELCRRRSGTFTEVASLVPPERDSDFNAQAPTLTFHRTRVLSIMIISSSIISIIISISIISIR